MIYVWTAIVFNSYLLTYLINTFDLVYDLAIATSIEEIIANMIGGFLYYKWGMKGSLFFCFGLATVCGLIICLYGLNNQNGWLFIAIYVCIDFGMTSAFEIIYIAHTSVFPTLFASTSFGYCNFVSRTSAALSP